MKKAIFLFGLTLIGISFVGSTEVLAQDAAPASDEGTGWIDFALYLSYVMCIIAALGAIIAPIFQAAGNPRSLLTSGLSLVALVVLFFIGYAISGNEVKPLYEEFNVGPGGSKAIGGALIASYIMTIIAVIGIVYTEISDIVR
jgi:uncharacterized membrane protein YvlD (DUF360 family)